MPQYLLREFKVTDARDGQSRTIRQFQFTDWPEQGVPKSGEGFIDFIGQVHKTAHNRRNQVVQVTKRRVREFQRAEADVVKRFVVKHDALVGVFDELVHGKRGVVRLDHGAGHLGRRYDREREHHAIGVLFANLRDEKRPHTGTGTASERVRHLETLQAVA